MRRPRPGRRSRSLSNQLGRPGGFAAIDPAGPDRAGPRAGRAAPRRLGQPPGTAHPPPAARPGRGACSSWASTGRITEPELETLHRDALGNPRAMLRIAAARGRASRPAAAEPPAHRPPGRADARAHAPSRESSPPGRADRRPADRPSGPGGRCGRSPRLPSLIPTRPPIRLEDGLVEVGWEGDLEAEPTRPEVAPSEPEVEPPGEADPGEELVEDRYAALQAWAEWSRNRERSAPAAADPATDAAPTATDDDDDPGSHPAGSARWRLRLPSRLLGPRRDARTTSPLTASSSPGSGILCDRA